MSEALFEQMRAALPGVTLRHAEALAAHTSFRIGGPAEVLACPGTEAELAAVFAFCAAERVPLRVLGGGTNILAPDAGVSGADAIIAYRADQLNPNRKKTDTSYLQTITCPWNSRQCKGLPPDAISNPGKEALYAVAHPASGDYLYFLTGDDGKMYYAKTEAEHNANIQKYCHEMCKIL